MFVNDEKWWFIIMSNFVNLYVKDGFVFYQITDRTEKLDEDYEAHILTEPKMAGRVGHALTMKYIERIIERLDRGEIITDGESG